MIPFPAPLRALLLVPAVLALATPAGAQEEEERPLGWDTGLTWTLGLAQTEIENLAEGGESSMTWNTLIEYAATRLSENSEWQTTADLEYGQTRSGEESFRKAADRLAASSIYLWGRDELEPYASVDARTQIAPGFEYDDEGNRIAEISRFANPLYLEQGVGVSRLWAPGFRTRAGLGMREVFVTESGALGDFFALRYTDDDDTPEIEKSRINPGAEVVTSYLREFPERKSKLDTKLSLFSAFENPANIDVNWEFRATSQIVGPLTASLSVDVIYDEDIVKRTQLRETLTLALAHTFF